MINAKKLYDIDIAHNEKILRLLRDGQEYRTFCHAHNGWATVSKSGEQFSVKLPKVRQTQVMDLASTVRAIVVAHHGTQTDKEM